MIIQKLINFSLYFERKPDAKLQGEIEINLEEITSYEKLINIVYDSFSSKLVRNDLFKLRLHYVDNYSDMSANIDFY